MSAPALRVLIVTEDGGRDAHDVVQNIFKHAARTAFPSLRVERLRFLSLPDKLREVARANQWKSRKHRDLVDFRRHLAAEIAQGVVVVVHLDGDRPWRERAQAENPAAFQVRVYDPIQKLLNQPPANLLRMVPFYSIEAWLYQNTTRARALCPRHVALFARWEQDRGALDELVRPKVNDHLQSRFNLDLSGRGYPRAAVDAAGKSFADFVEALRRCAALQDALDG